MLFVQTGYNIAAAIPVTVENGAISCPNAIISGKIGSAVDLEWQMVTGGYDIEDIDFIDQNGKVQFPGKGKPGKQYKLKNKMTQKGAYKYNIRVSGIDAKGTKFYINLDPMVRNEPN
jgi:hypothetical protein